MMKRTIGALALAATVVVGTNVCAEEAKPQSEVKLKEYGRYSGFEGNEEVLGASVSDAIVSQGGPSFEGREKELGKYVSTAIKTLNHHTPYDHKFNDALVKMTLEHINFAKANGIAHKLADDDIRVTTPMLKKVAKQIEITGDKETALTAIIDQTTCFFQLVDEVKREPGKVTYQDPFRQLLPITKKMGQYDLTDTEVHEIWTRPRIEGYGKVMGVELSVSDIDENGMITISIVPTS